MRFHRIFGIHSGINHMITISTIYHMILGVYTLDASQCKQNYRVVDDNGSVIGYAQKNYVVPVCQPVPCSSSNVSVNNTECLEECIGCGGNVCNEYVPQHNSSCYLSGSGGGCSACPGIVPKYPGCVPVLPPKESCSCNVTCTKSMPSGVYYCDTPQSGQSGQCQNIGSNSLSDVCHSGQIEYYANNANCSQNTVSPPILTPTCDMPDVEGCNDAIVPSDNVVWECEKGSSPNHSKRFSHGRWYWSPMSGRWMWEDGKWTLNQATGQYDFVVGTWQFKTAQDVVVAPTSNQPMVFVA